MTTYQFTDASQTVVHVIDADGVSRSSMLASQLPPGTPVLSPDIDHAAEKAAVLAEARAVRERVFAVLAGMQAEALALGDSATALAIADAQAGLRGITTLPSVVASATGLDTRNAIMLAYSAIAAAAPPSVRTAFRVLGQ